MWRTETVITGLPLDVLGEIALQLNAHQVAAFRATGRSLCHAMDPFFYDCFILDASRVNGTEGVLVDIDAGTSKWARYARVLKVEARGAVQGETAKALICAALARFANIRVVRWYAKDTDPRWLLAAISAFLSTNATLETLDLRILGALIEPLGLSGVPSVRSLQVIGWSIPQSAAATEDISALIQRSAASGRLSTLELVGVNDYAALWPALAAATKTQLRTLRCNTPPSLLGYLSSRSGLEKLVLEALRHQTDQQIAEELFNVALPRHASSLKRLAVTPNREGVWSFGERYAAGLVKLVGLRELEVSVMRHDADAVTALLSTLSSLPLLQTLRISSSSPQIIGCGNGLMQHGPLATMAAVSAVETFRSNVAHPAEVFAGRVRFVQVLEQESGRYRYEVQNPKVLPSLTGSSWMTLSGPGDVAVVPQKRTMPNHKEKLSTFRFPAWRQALEA